MQKGSEGFCNTTIATRREGRLSFGALRGRAFTVGVAKRLVETQFPFLDRAFDIDIEAAHNVAAPVLHDAPGAGLTGKLVEWIEARRGPGVVL